MRILLLTDSFLPNKTSVARMINELATELVRGGNEVTVITSTQDISSTVKVEIKNGYNVCYVKAGKSDHISRISRAFSEMLLPFIVWQKAKTEIRQIKPELIVWYSPTIFWGWLAYRISREFKAYRYLILRDIFPRWALDVGHISRLNPAYWLFCAFEQFQYQVADRIGVQSPSNLDYFRLSTSLAPKTEVLWNWGALSQDKPCGNRYRKLLSLENKVVFFYGGNMGVAQRVDRLLSLAANLSEERSVHFVLVGEGSEREQLKKNIAARSIKNITILPPASQEEFSEMLAEFDVGIVLLDPMLSTHNIPGKLISYAAAGKPILADVNEGNDVIELLRSNRAGLTSVNNESLLLLNAKLLLENAQLRFELGTNAYSLADKLFSASSAALQITKSHRS